MARHEPRNLDAHFGGGMPRHPDRKDFDVMAEDNEQHSEIRARVTALELWKAQRDIESARHDERWKHMDDRFNRVEKSLTDMSGSITWVLRIVIGGILAGIIAFMIKGGFAP